MSLEVSLWEAIRVLALSITTTALAVAAFVGAVTARRAVNTEPLLESKSLNNRRAPAIMNLYFQDWYLFRRENQFHKMFLKVVYERNSFVGVRDTIQRHL
jgi:hypothetical protein